MTKELSKEHKQMLKSALQSLVENTDSVDIATTDENLTADQMFQRTSLPSLARLIFSTAQLGGPTAALFNIVTKSDNSGIKLLRKEVEVYQSDPISTGITQETIQDLRNQYGKQADEIIGTLIRSLANNQENEKALDFLEANSSSAGTLTLSNTNNSQIILFELVQKVHELIMKSNSNSHITYEAYCVLPYKLAASVVSLNKYIGGDEEKGPELWFATHGGVKFYLNPDVNITDTVYVGLKSDSNLSKSAAVFSPYQSTVVEAQDSDTGEMFYHLFNRFAITSSPLNTVEPLMHKFTVQ